MNIKSLYILIISATLTLSSCTDWLSLDPTDSVTDDNFFKDRDDAYMALVASYRQLMSDYLNTSFQPIAATADVMSDDLYPGGSSSSDQFAWQNSSRFRSNPNDDTPQLIWKKCYMGITRANNLINKYPDIEFKENEQEDKVLFEAEARFLRGHYYFELLRYYENVPLILEQLEGESANKITQTDPHLVYAQAAEDFLFGAEFMAKNDPEEGRLSQYAAKAEFLKMYLFYTGYYNKTSIPVGEDGEFSLSDAVLMADDILTNSGAKLLANYADLFGPKGDYNEEVIFEIPFMSNGGWDWWDKSTGNMQCIISGPRGHDAGVLGWGWGFCIPTRDLVDSFEDGDSRTSATVISARELVLIGTDTLGIDASYNSTGYYSYKYTTHADRKPVAGDYMLNWEQNYHYIRLADVYLMAAELHFKNGNTGLAMEYVNVIRDRAGLADVTSIDMEVIMQERRCELALEGHRYWDLLRQGVDYAAEKISVNSYEMITDEKVPAFGDVGKESDYLVTFDRAKRGFLPIPQRELDLNSNLDQNTGY